MGTVLYNIETKNKELKRILNNAVAGRELVRNVLLRGHQDINAEKVNKVNSVVAVTLNGDEFKFKIKELGAK